MFKTNLMRHQQAAITKLKCLKVGALFMEMGTGKTRLYLELAFDKISREKATHIVILCPVSALLHTADEVLKHTGIHAVIHNGSYNNQQGLINLIGIESMSSSISAYNKLDAMMDGAVLIIDESHMVKNQRALRTEHIKAIANKAPYRFLSTGTPMTNGIEDLWSQFQILSPSILGYKRFAEFANMHLKYMLDEYGYRGKGKIIGRFNTDLVSQKIAPYTFQVKKADCFSLPDKTYSYATAYMDDSIKTIYEETKNRILFGKSAFEASDATIYRLFTSLHQISSGIIPEIIADRFDKIDNPKIAILKQQMDGLPKGSKTVIFVSYKAELKAAYNALQNTSYQVMTIHGGIKPVNRYAIIKEFKNSGDILIATTATGGQSIDLSFADYAVYMSNRFDYKDRIQSEDRIHRFGMTGNAHYLDIRMDCGIEKMITRSLERKSNAAKDFMEKLRYMRTLPEKQSRQAINEEISSL